MQIAKRFVFELNFFRFFDKKDSYILSLCECENKKIETNLERKKKIPKYERN